MDEELRDAARAFEADPTDTAVAKRYEANLVRAGETTEVQRRYRMALLCDKDWNKLAIDQFHTGVKTRYCVDCKRLVHRVANAKEFERRVKAGDCVMIFETQDSYFQLSTDLAPGFVVGLDKKRDYQEAPEVQARRLPCVIELTQKQREAAERRRQEMASDMGFGLMGRVVGPERHT